MWGRLWTPFSRAADGHMYLGGTDLLADFAWVGRKHPEVIENRGHVRGANLEASRRGIMLSSPGRAGAGFGVAWAGRRSGWSGSGQPRHCSCGRTGSAAERVDAAGPWGSCSRASKDAVIW